MERWERSLLMKLVVFSSLVMGALCSNDGGDFSVFYFMQQWLGSYCNQQGTTCCYPPTKPGADFTIYGLWPYYTDGSFPSNCPGASFDVAPLKPIESQLQQSWPSFTCPLIGRKFWLHEWNKRGNCSKSVLDEMAYFQAALDLKDKINLLQILAEAGISPNNQLYSLESVKTAISKATGFNAWISCNHNAQGTSQIWQITFCADGSGTKLVECPVTPEGTSGCADNIQFPSF